MAAKKGSSYELARKLLVVKMIHSVSETALFYIRTKMERQIFERGKQIHAARRDERIFGRCWRGVERSLEKRLRGEDFGKIRVYLEGNHMGGPEAVERCRELAGDKGQWNARVVLKLIQRGAALMKTEDRGAYLTAHILFTMYDKDLQDKKIVPKKGREDELDKFMIGEINKERDECIAKNISRSLKKGEIGVLFIGKTHRVEEWLPEDIEIEYLADGALKRMENQLQRRERKRHQKSNRVNT